MNAAQQFLSSLAAQDSNTVYAAVEDAAQRGDVQESQDWKSGRSTWTFADGSAIVMEGSDVVAE